MRLEFVGQSSRDSTNVEANPSRLINGYREPLVPGGRSQYTIRAVPGMAAHALVNNIFMRAMFSYNGLILAVVGMNLYSITAGGTVANLGSVGALNEIVGIDKNTGIATIVAGGVYRTWNGTTLAVVATGQVTAPGSVCYLGGYTIVTQIGGRVFSWCDLALPSTWSGLNFASAEITDEPLIRGIAFKDAIFLFKASGFERWATSGLAGASAFQRISGAQEEPGLRAYGLIATFPNGFAFIGNDGRVHAYNGGGVGPISTPPIEVALDQDVPVRMFFYERRGHGFICIAFENAPAWCYDVATGEWHERAQDGGPWMARDTVKFNNDWYVGTDDGQIAKLSPICADFDAPLVRQYTSRTLEESQPFRISKLEVFPRITADVQGDGDGTEAKIGLKMSHDGVQFGTEKFRGVGAVGHYQTRLVWRELGQFRKATMQLTLSSLTDLPISAEVEIDAA